MDRTRKLSDGRTVNVNLHGKPTGARGGAKPRKKLAGGLYYIEHEGQVFVYTAEGELETILRSPEQAHEYAERKAKGTE